MCALEAHCTAGTANQPAPPAVKQRPPDMASLRDAGKVMVWAQGQAEARHTLEIKYAMLLSMELRTAAEARQSKAEQGRARRRRCRLVRTL